MDCGLHCQVYSQNYEQLPSKVMYSFDLYIAPYYGHISKSKARYGPVIAKGSQFCLPATHEPYLSLLVSRTASPPSF